MTETVSPGIQLKPGSRLRTLVPAALRPDGSPIGIPVTALRGTSSGPRVLVCGGVHGDEFVGPEAIRRLMTELEPGDIAGCLIAIPCANVPAFESRSRSGSDGLNLNRVFPGDPSGTVTQRIAHALSTEILPEVDYVVDCHSGSSINRCATLAIYADDPAQPEVTGKSLDLAEASGVSIIWRTRGEFGGTLTDAAVSRGIPAITIEVGGEGRAPTCDVAEFTRTLRNVLTHVGMLPGARPSTHRDLVRVTGHIINSRNGGVFRSNMTVGAQVSKGDVLAEIVDLFGDVVEQVVSTDDGMVGSVRTSASIGIGELVVYLLTELIQ